MYHAQLLAVLSILKILILFVLFVSNLVGQAF